MPQIFVTGNILKNNKKRNRGKFIQNLYKNVDKDICNIYQIIYNKKRIFLNLICYNKGKPIVM